MFLGLRPLLFGLFARAFLGACLLSSASVASAAEDCALIETGEVERILHAAARELSGDGISAQGDEQSVLAHDILFVPDVYRPRFDQFLPQAYRGRQGWDEFRAAVGQWAFGDFRVESVLARSGCRVSIVTGRFHVSSTDEYVPWFYNAAVVRRGGGLRLTFLRLPTAIPRKKTGEERAPCLMEEPDAAIVGTLREAFVSALRSADEEKIAGLFSRTGAFDFFDPTFSERVRGIEQMVLARAATANFFRGARIEDLPGERRSRQFCSNLNYAGVLNVTMPDGRTFPVGYRNHAFLKPEEERQYTSQINMTLLDAEIADNLPEDMPEWLREAAAEMRAWVKPK